MFGKRWEMGDGRWMLGLLNPKPSTLNGPQGPALRALVIQQIEIALEE